LQGLEPDVALSLSPVTDFLKTWMIYNEDPTHMQLKKQMSRVFHKDNVHPMKQVIVDTAHALIDRIVERHPDGKFDFVSEYAHPLPAIVLGTMLGVPHDGIERFLQWSDQLAAFMQDFVVSPRPNPMLVSATARAIEEMKEFFGAAVQARQRGSGPQDALADTVARTDLGESVVRNQCIHLMFGGHKVPEFLAGNLLQALLQNPHVFREVRKNRELINQATSEAIRYNSPIQFITRAANEQVPFHGQILQPGEQLMLYIASANRDERVFDSPDDFDIHRSQNKHLGFGAGTHACLGTPLVHLELHSMMDVLFDRFPKLELVYPDIPPAWMSNPTFHGLTSLMISFEN
jgi:cytochrome P450